MSPRELMNPEISKPATWHDEITGAASKLRPCLLPTAYRLLLSDSPDPPEAQARAEARGGVYVGWVAVE